MYSAFVSIVAKQQLLSQSGRHCRFEVAAHIHPNRAEIRFLSDAARQTIHILLRGWRHRFLQPDRIEPRRF